MYSTTTLAKHSKLDGHLVGTHQQLDQAARRALMVALPKGAYFPSSREIIYFEGMRGPDGLKRKSPDQDDPSHMFEGAYGDGLVSQILEHYANLVASLRTHDHIRAAFEAAWLAHFVTDGLTPAHHFPLSEAKEELMSNKEFIKIFGEPVKGLMHGRNLVETMRNNWTYWGAGGHMSKHIAYEYGVAVIVAMLPPKVLTPKMGANDFRETNPAQIFSRAVEKLQPAQIYADFRQNGWTRAQVLTTKNLLLPEITRTLARIWFAAFQESSQNATQENFQEVHG